MTSRLRSAGLVVAAVSSVLLLPLSGGVASAAPSGPVVVVSGLNNPRGLALTDDVLFVAEAGKGGTVAIVSSPDGSTQGLGYTGSVSAVIDPSHAINQPPLRVVTGLLSAAANTASPGQPIGSGATGPDGVAAPSLAKLSIIETTFEPATPAPSKRLDGHLLSAVPFGPVRPVADITGYEAAHDPDGQGIDSNPYGVVSYRGGSLVADAAANDVLKVSSDGHVSLFHVFPNITGGACAGQFDPAPPFAGCNFVPTSLATDRWGNVYVGALGSLVPGAGEVVELNSAGQVLKTWTGFTSVTGVALGHDGSVYVSQLFGVEAAPPVPGLQGVVTKISHGTRTDYNVPFPAGIVVDPSDNVYVSAFSILPGTGAGIPGVNTSGQVWRLRF